MTNFSKSNQQGWHPSTDLGCDMKTILSTDVRMRTGKDYRGILRRDSDTIADEFLYRDAHYTFIETLPATNGKRNPRLFDGQFITITRHADGTLHPNFKQIKMEAGFNIDTYAIAVMGELRRALKGLVEK